MQHALKQSLDHLYAQYDAAYLDMDPLALVTQFDKPEDQEVAGFVAAVLALGRWEQIKKTVSAMLDRMQPAPAAFVRNFHPVGDGNPFSDLKHRFYDGNDLGLMVHWLGQLLRRWPTLEASFLEGYSPSHDSIGPALSGWVQLIASLDTAPFYPSLPPPGRGAAHFLTDPMKGSAAKRLCLFLRWMVRRDNLDLGLWTQVRPAQLVIPLDVHISRMGRRLGLTERSTPGWAMALEITRSLARLDPLDPVKYDFSLCTLGKLNPCRAEGGCGSCPIAGGCAQAERTA